MNEEVEKILFGCDKTKFIVGIDYDERTSEANTFIKSENKLIAQKEKFFPFLLVNSEKSIELAGVPKGTFHLEGLHGDDTFKLLLRFENVKHYEEALSKLSAYYRKEKDNLTEEPYLNVGDIAHQYMLLSGKTHYLGMEWDDISELDVAIRLNVSSELANPMNLEQAIIVFGMRLGNKEIILDLDNFSEPEMIREFVKIVEEYDPDVICGHNLFKFTLNFIAERAKRYKIPLKLGRGGRVAVSERYRMPLAERRLEFPRIRAFGRSLIDSWILVQTYDIFKREMDNYELAYCAEYLGIRNSMRTPFTGSLIGDSYTQHLPKLKEDVAKDLIDTAQVVRTLIPTFFYFCQMLPYTLEETVIRGNATKINSLFLREYLRRGESIPAPMEARWFPGGFTEIRKTGVIRPVISADVASLYPSLILTHKLFPKADRLGLFEKILKELLAFRLEIKAKLKKIKSEDSEFYRLEARQGTFKIIINSFYGYLGTDRMNFADIDSAERVTALGQEAVKGMAKIIENLGAEIVEIDTDGIYLRPPEKFIETNNYEEFIELINMEMPEGITVELGGVYPAMLSYKVKNYALLAEDSRVIIKGSGLKSRGLEPYLRMFIESAVRLVLFGKGGEIDQLYEDFRKRLREGVFSVFELAKTETLVDSIETYERKIKTTRRNRQAQYEVAKRACVPMKPGDFVTYYITGDSPKVKAYEVARHINEFNPEMPDINIAFYEKRLAETYKRVKEFVS